MNLKRLLCAVLALVLLFSAQLPAAASNKGNQRSIIITARCRLPVIRVTVPSYASVYINPLKLPVYIDGESDTDQIISTPSMVINYSEVPLVVDVEVSGSVKEGSNMTLASSPTNGAGSDKRAFVYFEIVQAETDDLTDDVEWAPAYDAAKHLAVIPGAPKTMKQIFTLSARTLDGEVAEGGYAPFRLSGDAVKTPANAWNSKDGVNVTVAFTFTPISYS